MKIWLTSLFLSIIISLSPPMIIFGANNTPEINLYFVRHGRTILNNLDIVQGWSDSPLTQEGLQRAKETAYGMSDIKFDFVYSSDTVRAVETAEIIMEHNNVSEKKSPIKMQGLRETNFGKYEGDMNDVMWGVVFDALEVSNTDELYAKYDNATKLMFDAIAASDETGEAEDYDECVKRLMEAVDTIIEEVASNGGGNVLVVGHGAAISKIINKLSGIDTGQLANASLSLIKYKDGKFDVTGFNDLSYLEKGAQFIEQNFDDVSLYLVPNGKTIFDKMDRIEGWSDSPLTEEGIEYAKTLGKELSKVHFSKIFSSDLNRSINTGQIILSQNDSSNNLDINTIKDLRGTYYGKYESSLKPELVKLVTDYYNMSDKNEFITLDDFNDNSSKIINILHEIDESREAESYSKMSERAFRAFKEIADMAYVKGWNNVLIVSHEDAIMAILNQLDKNQTKLDTDTKPITKITYSKYKFEVESTEDQI